MKTLSLYIDKWYITGAVNNDGSCVPLVMPNGEDRIWLYFFEDRENQCIRYGKAYESEYKNKAPRYIGDVFSLLTDDSYTFQKYSGQNQHIIDIFKFSGIFDHIRESLSLKEDEQIETYLCFSEDIDKVAQYMFRNELAKSNFEEKKIIAPLSELALYECKKRNGLIEGKYLVVEATNENMRYSLYDYKDNFFENAGSYVLNGYGIDPRGKVLVDFILENLKVFDAGDKNIERLKLYSQVEKWLSDMDRNGQMPFPISDIRLVSEPYNPKNVLVIPKEISNRTKGEIEKITNQIIADVRNTGFSLQDFNAIVLIGDIFTNEEFRNNLGRKMNIGDRSVLRYGIHDLYQIVNMFNEIDVTKYSDAYEKEKKSASDTDRIRKAENEKKRNDEAARQEAARIRQERELARETENNYNDAITKAEDFERAKDYQNMMEWAKIALSNVPEDEYANELLERARNFIAEENVKKEQFNRNLEKSRNYFLEKRWNDALHMCDSALEIYPDSKEAQKIKTEAQRMLGIEQNINNYITRCDVFFAQKLYNEALNEIDKILSLKSDNEYAVRKKTEIEKILEESLRYISELKSKYEEAVKSGDFRTAIDMCNQLEIEDITNASLWRKKKQDLEIKEREQEQLDSLRKKIENKYFDEEWAEVVSLCDKFLDIQFDEKISTFRERSLKKLSPQTKPKPETIEPVSGPQTPKPRHKDDGDDFFDSKKKNSSNKKSNSKPSSGDWDF